jgi:hypothetical protein
MEDRTKSKYTGFGGKDGSQINRPKNPLITMKVNKKERTALHLPKQEPKLSKETIKAIKIALPKPIQIKPAPKRKPSPIRKKPIVTKKPEPVLQTKSLNDRPSRTYLKINDKSGKMVKE